MKTQWAYIAAYKEEVAALIQQQLAEQYEAASIKKQQQAAIQHVYKILSSRNYLALPHPAQLLSVSA